MRILSKLLFFFTQSSEVPSEPDTEHARVRCTERVIERYDQMLNANSSLRKRGLQTAREGESNA